MLSSLRVKVVRHRGRRKSEKISLQDGIKKSILVMHRRGEMMHKLSIPSEVPQGLPLPYPHLARFAYRR
jgi:hypothetical protein